MFFCLLLFKIEENKIITMKGGFMDLLKGFSHLNHASIKYKGDTTVYVDPFQIKDTPGDADFIFCTHAHFDHFSPADIKKIMKAETVLVVSQDSVKKCKKLGVKEVIGVEPNQEYEAGGMKFKTVPSYNVDKKFHKKKEDWVGYILYINDASYYFAGDSDYIPEMDSIKADVVFLPVGGTYTMTALEAAKAANSIKPKAAVPIHFGSVVGSKSDADTFIKNLDKDIKGVIL